MKSGEIEI